METKRWLSVGFLVLLSACKAECSCSGSGDDDEDDDGSGGSTSVQATSSSGGGEGGSGTTTGTTTTGTGGNGGAGGGAPAETLIRLAHLSPDTVEVNVCLLPDLDGAEPIGPLVGEGGLSFPSVTEYVAIEPGTYGLRVVAGTATDCGTGILEVEPFEIAEGTTTTLAATGLSAAEEGSADALGISAYSDDLTAPTAGNARLRLIHAAPGVPPVDVGMGTGDDFVAVWEAVTYGDDAGYVETAAFGPTDFAARVTGTTADALIISGVEGPDGALVEGFAVGTVDTGIDVLFITSGVTE